jgi:hypothetical protein
MSVSLNIFRVTADLLHLAAMLIMLYRIRTLKTCAGATDHHSALRQQTRKKDDVKKIIVFPSLHTIISSRQVCR